MRVKPWNQYQLVDLKADPDLQLAPGKKKIVSWCAAFVSCGCAAAGHQSSSALKVGPTKQHDILLRAPESSEKDQTHAISTSDNNNIANKVDIKSSLKKTPSAISGVVNSGNETLSKKKINIPGHTERKVQWMDVYGGQLVEIREYEPSAELPPGHTIPPYHTLEAQYWIL